MAPPRRRAAIALLCLFFGTPEALRLYTFPLQPSENPDYDRYAVKHPTPDVFGNEIQFATLRGFQIDQNSTVVNYAADLKKYCLDPGSSLGTVVWPMYPLLFATNFEEVVDALHKNSLFVTDIWAFVPGSGPGNGSRWRENVWQQFYPPPTALDYMEKTMGEKWLGMDVGEQDGRYIGGFANQMIPLSQDRRDQFLNFRRHFRGMEEILGPKLVALVSLTFPHYLAKTGLYTVVGAEAAQALPNSQVFYAFIRGAGKQYGVLWFGNVSVYNRFGYKTYPGTMAGIKPLGAHYRKAVHGIISRNYTCHSQGDGGPTCGTSLNLMKRLLYSHMMYGSSYVSFENGWFIGSTANLSPIGKIQHAAKKFATSEKPLGVHVATIGLYLDFFTGFCPPRHLYSGNLYRSWGNLPYSEGDYLADGILRTVYPQYQDSSYFHNETGFSSSTPFGDTLDVLLSDSPQWVISQYDTLIVASNLSGGYEVKDNLERFVFSGGELAITAGNIAKLPSGILGFNTDSVCKYIASGSKVYLYNGETIIEQYNMTVCGIKFPSNCTILAKLEDSTPLAVRLQISNAGSLTVFATPFAISYNVVSKPSSQIDISLPSPYPLLDHAQTLLDALFTNATLFTSSANLSLVPTYTSKDQFYLLVSNPELREQPLKLLSPQGTITGLKEIPLDQSEKGAEGYLPDGFEGADIGHSTNTTIAGGDTRLFAAILSSDSLHFLPKVQPKPRPIGVALHLRHIDRSIRYEVLLRPTFFQHYDSVVVDYSYLITKDDEFLKQESRWLKQQNVSVYVDASPSVNLFPTLRLTNDAPDLHNETMQSLTRLLYKMNALGSCDLIMSLHGFPTGQTRNESLQDFSKVLHYLESLGSQLNITVHMLDAQKNRMDVMRLSRWLLSCNLTSIKFVMNTASLTYDYRAGYDDIIKSHSSMLYVGAPGWDMYGACYSDNMPLSKVNSTIRTQVEDVIKHVCTLQRCPYQSNSTATGDSSHYARNQQKSAMPKEKDGVYPMVMDAAYANGDEEFADVHLIENLLLQG
jgi:hypothetical protein